MACNTFKKYQRPSLGFGILRPRCLSNVTTDIYGAIMIMMLLVLTFST